MGVLYPMLWKDAFRSNTKWLSKHTTYQGSGFALALVGTLVSIAVVDAHAANTHTKVGLSTMIICVQHVFFAVIRPYKVDEETRKEDAMASLSRDLWSYWHKACGYITIVLAWTNVYLGFSVSFQRSERRTRTGIGRGNSQSTALSRRSSPTTTSKGPRSTSSMRSNLAQLRRTRSSFSSSSSCSLRDSRRISARSSRARRRGRRGWAGCREGRKYISTVL